MESPAPARSEVLGILDIRGRLAIVDPGYLRHWHNRTPIREISQRRWRETVSGSLVGIPPGRYAVVGERLLDEEGVADPHLWRLVIRPERGEIGPMEREVGAPGVAVDGGTVAVFDIKDLKHVLRTTSGGLGVIGPAIVASSGGCDGIFGVFVRRHAAGARSVLVDFLVHLDADDQAEE